MSEPGRDRSATGESNAKPSLEKRHTNFELHESASSPNQLIKSRTTGPYDTTRTALTRSQSTPAVHDTHAEHTIRRLAGLIEDASGEMLVQVSQEPSGVFTWGEALVRNAIGRSSNVTEPFPIESLQGLPIKSVACGAFHTMLLTENGGLYTCGSPTSGLGAKAPTENLPTIVKELEDEKIVQIAGGWSHAAALTDDGKVYTWGSSAANQLGYQTGLTCNTPRRVDCIKGTVKEIACGSTQTLAVTETGELWHWGNNRLWVPIVNDPSAEVQESNVPEAGGVDTNYTVFVPPAKVDLESPVVRVACGDTITAVVLQNEPLRVFGKLGILPGLGDPTDKFSEFNSSNIRAIACLYDTVLIVTTEGELINRNSGGDLKIDLPAGMKAKEVSCGQHIVAIVTESHQLVTFNPNLCFTRSDIHIVHQLEYKRVRSVSCGSSHVAVVADPATTPRAYSKQLREAVKIDPDVQWKVADESFKANHLMLKGRNDRVDALIERVKPSAEDPPVICVEDGITFRGLSYFIEYIASDWSPGLQEQGLEENEDWVFPAALYDLAICANKFEEHALVSRCWNHLVHEAEYLARELKIVLPLRPNPSRPTPRNLCLEEMLERAELLAEVAMNLQSNQFIYHDLSGAVETFTTMAANAIGCKPRVSLKWCPTLVDPATKLPRDPAPQANLIGLQEEALLEHPRHPPQLLRKLVNDPSANLTLATKDGDIRIHKCIASARNEHFKTILASGMREAVESRIDLSLFPRDIVLPFVEWLYAGATEFASDNLVEMIKLADAMVDEELKMRCQRVLQHVLDEDNAAQLMYLAQLYNCNYLTKISAKKVETSFDAILDSGVLEDLDMTKNDGLTVELNGVWMPTKNLTFSAGVDNSPSKPPAKSPSRKPKKTPGKGKSPSKSKSKNADKGLVKVAMLNEQKILMPIAPPSERTHKTKGSPNAGGKGNRTFNLDDFPTAVEQTDKLFSNFTFQTTISTEAKAEVKKEVAKADTAAPASDAAECTDSPGWGGDAASAFSFSPAPTATKAFQFSPLSDK